MRGRLVWQKETEPKKAKEISSISAFDESKSFHLELKFGSDEEFVISIFESGFVVVNHSEDKEKTFEYKFFSKEEK